MNKILRPANKLDTIFFFFFCVSFLLKLDCLYG